MDNRHQRIERRRVSFAPSRQETRDFHGRSAHPQRLRRLYSLLKNSGYPCQFLRFYPAYFR